MRYPQGFNPVGEHAPGLPRHDAPLPGHAPSSYAPPADDVSSAPTYAVPYTGSSAYTGYNGYAGSGSSRPAFGIWSGRIIMLCAIAVTLPVQIVLYPIAGAVAIGCGRRRVSRAAGSGDGAVRQLRMELDSLFFRAVGGDAPRNRI